VADRPAIHIEGLDELRRGLRRAKDAGLNQALRDANKEIAKAIVDKALPNVPVRSGRLKRSVRALGNLGGAVGKAGSASVPYAQAIHWGQSTGNTNFKTGKYSKGRHAIAGRPFLREAAQEIERTVIDDYQADILQVFEALRGVEESAIRSR
jgi:hypothetical protein